MSSCTPQRDLSRDGAILGQLDTFTCFRKLPREIRLHIWREVAHQRRNIDIYIEDAHIESQNGKSQQQLRQLRRINMPDHPLPRYQIMSRSPQPAVLQICQESLYECRKFFSLEFGVLNYSPSTTNQHTTVISSAKVYVQWKVDRLCLIDSSINRRDLQKAINIIIVRAITRQATSIALNICQNQDFYSGHTYHLRNLAEFAYHTCAEDVIIVWQPRIHKNGSSIDANGRINWTFTGYTTDYQTLVSDQDTFVDICSQHFQRFLRDMYLTKEELALPPKERVEKSLEKILPTNLRICNEYKDTAGSSALRKRQWSFTVSHV